MTDVRDATAIRDDLRTLGRLPVTLTDQGAPLRLAGDVAPLLDRCGFLERVLERAERERDDASAELAVLRAQRDALLADKPGDPVWSAEFDRLHGVIASLAAQRDAALALCDHTETETAKLHTRGWVPYVLTRDVRAALGVQPEGSSDE